MYTVDPSIWIKVATMHFSGRAARCVQSLECKLVNLTWHEFCVLLKDRFGQDQHEHLIRQMLHIKQTGTVVQYVEEFSQLVDQLNAY